MPDIDNVEFFWHADPHELEKIINKKLLDIACPKLGGEPIAKIIKIDFQHSDHHEMFIAWIHSRGY